MKKKIVFISIIVSSIVSVATVAICIWLLGYHTRKSQDNLPTLEAIAKMDEADLNELLVGYRNHQLEDVWGYPDDKTSDNIWIWKLDEYNQLQVSSNNEDKVVVCSIDAVFRAIVWEISDDYYMIEPEEGSPERRSAAEIRISRMYLDSAFEVNVGDVVEVIHSGDILETYPASLRDVYSVRIVTEAEK